MTQIARFEVGSPDDHLLVIVTQDAENLYTVSEQRITDEENEGISRRQFANADLAFRHAMRCAQDEVDDVCDTCGQ